MDVSAAAGTGEQLRVAATVLLPDGLADRPGEPRTVVVGFPGGGYNRRYYDLDIPGHDGLQPGAVPPRARPGVRRLRPPGRRRRDTPACPLDYDAVARANMHAAREILRLLRGGGIAGDVPPVSVGAAAAIGQSFGGFLLVIGQAIDPVFDGIGVLGYSARDPQTPPWPAHLTVADE